MIKIASLAPYKFIPAVKGGEKAIYYLLKYLGLHTAVDCFTVAENCFSGKENFALIPLLGSSRNKWRYINPFLFFKLKKELKQRGHTKLIIEHPYYGWLGFLLKKITGVHLIVHSHNIESSRFKTMGKWWWKILYHYEKFTHQIADLNFFITEEDKDYAIHTFHLKPEKCTVIAYGIENNNAPAIEEKTIAKQALCKEAALPLNTILILFNGTLDYPPNREGLDFILQQINPILLNKMTKPYKIIVCGLRLPAAYNDLKAYEKDNIIYKGFVEDINLYFKAADIFINPIVEGGGIKTKLVEALGANTASVSFKAGAFGIPVSVTGNHLKIVDDRDVEAFANTIILTASEEKQDIPQDFFKHFNLNSIAKKAVEKIKGLK